MFKWPVRHRVFVWLLKPAEQVACSCVLLFLPSNFSVLLLVAWCRAAWTMSGSSPAALYFVYGIAQSGLWLLLPFFLSTFMLFVWCETSICTS